MSDRIHPAAIDATGYVGDGAQYLADDGTWKVVTGGGGGVESIVAGTGIAVDSTDPANPVVSATGGGGGGGGGAIHYSDTLGGADFSTTTSGGYVTVPGLSLSITPAVTGVLRLSLSIVLYSTATGGLNAKIMCSPNPVVGPASARARNDSGTSNKAESKSLTRTYTLAAGTTYAFTVVAYQQSGGTLTVFGDQEQTELSGKFTPI